MTTTTVFAATSDGRVRSTDGDYATAAAGADLHLETSGDNASIGQATVFEIYQAFFGFDTSGIADGDTVSQVDLSLYGAGDNSNDDFVLTALNYNWSGGGLTIADFRNPTQLGALTSLATFNTSGFDDSDYNTFTSAGAVFNSHINKTGTTYLMVVSDQNIAASEPTDDEFVDVSLADEIGTTQDPKLVITHATAGGAIEVDADAGAYAVTGTAASLERGREVAGGTASYAVTGGAASLERGFEVVGGAGSYAVAGQAATFPKTWIAEANAGSYVVTGQAASLERVLAVVGDAGSYAVTGQDATPKITGYVAAAAAGSYGVTGATASLERGTEVAADAGSYSVSGQAATFPRTYIAEAGVGSYAVTGQQASLELGREVVAGVGSYAVTGSDATLEIDTPGALNVDAETGAYSVSGQAAGFLRAYIAEAGAGAYAVTGATASLERGSEVVAGAGSYAATGADSDLIHTEVPGAILLAADAGSYVVSGQLAGLEYGEIEEVRRGGGTGGKGTRKRRKDDLPRYLRPGEAEIIRENRKKRRRTIWERPKEVAVEAIAATSTPAKAYVDRSVLAELDIAAADTEITLARAALAVSRSKEYAALEGQRQAKIAEIKAARELKEQARLAAIRDDEEAVVALLLAA